MKSLIRFKDQSYDSFDLTMLSETKINVNGMVIKRVKNKAIDLGTCNLSTIIINAIS